MSIEGRKRVIIENVKPEIDGGQFPIKRIVNDTVKVQADVFSDGHDEVVARLRYRKMSEKRWNEVPMKFLGNDRWEGIFTIKEMTTYVYTIEGWVDRFLTWQKAIQKKHEAGQDLKVEFLVGVSLIKEASKRATGQDAQRLAELGKFIKNENIVQNIAVVLSHELTVLMSTYPERRFSTRYGKELLIAVERSLAGFSSWYEMFPRSASPDTSRFGTLKDCIDFIPELAKMGFDILYLPPLHPIGQKNRKGKNNSQTAGQSAPGSPWAIGAEEGGHMAVLSDLGTVKDVEKLVREAKRHNVEIAIDIAYQCSPDHPYIKDHPDWFIKRPDGTIQYAENPPKKYEDIVPFNFETEEWNSLWNELKKIILFWIGKRIRIFRVDNPHTKPFLFWDWLIGEIKKDYPDTIFLSEAFTRPKVMYRLAKSGFSQSYTYFTWRNTKKELIEYCTALTQSDVCEYFRPNFWPNTPDILPEFLQYGERAGFMIRFILAATLSSNYGIYGPPFELCVDAALSDREEYRNSEKYEVRHWDRHKEGNLVDLISRVNQIRRDNPALHMTGNVKFYDVDNDSILFYVKATDDLSNIVLIVVNLDPYHTQSGWVHVPLKALGLDPAQPYLVYDMLSNDKYIWHGERSYVELNPFAMPAHILRVHRRLKREVDFDYYL
ncbi:MAG: alpha-1,4-glucan--maltose-1-phosphate maltosyltransferase [Candidatus Omnitrophica bacterium]|nr:alpha-1,4-glucan--maltose-1-phosphate maltosyltransferase [Candidatus Omnitrophota bacterium]